MNTIKNTCPVCGAGPEKRKERSFDCTACGTENAFVEYFVSQAAYNRWSQYIRQRCQQRREQRLTRLRAQSSLIVGPESLSFHDGDEKRLVTFDRGGKAVTASNVKQYSVSNLHQVTLKTNGIPTARGGNDAGQCRLPDRKDIISVLAAPRCTYLVSADGTVHAYGATSLRDQLAGWANIKAIACGGNHVAGLTADGTVVQADSQSPGRSSAETASWRGVTAIAASSNYTLGLHSNGTVSYAGPKAEVAKEVASWRNVISIAADTQYALGLTADGGVLMAGSCSHYLDGGRSEARNWKDILCIGAGRGVIAGLNANGQLLLAGPFLYGAEITAAFQKNNPAKI